MLDTMLGYLDFAFEIKEFENPNGVTLQIYSPEKERLLGRRLDTGGGSGVATPVADQRLVGDLTVAVGALHGGKLRLLTPRLGCAVGC